MGKTWHRGAGDRCENCLFRVADMGACVCAWMRGTVVDMYHKTDGRVSMGQMEEEDREAERVSISGARERAVVQKGRCEKDNADTADPSVAWFSCLILI